MPLDLERTLKELVALPSVNPMHGPPGPECGEERVTAYLCETFARLGLPHQRQTVSPGRDNVFACLQGESDRIVMLEAHQDTVPVEGMVIPPFEPRVEGGRLYGRGSCDVKGGMTVMLAAMIELMENRPAGMPTVVFAGSVNEEHGFDGAAAFDRFWTESDLVPRRPDLAIVAEPTNLDVVVAHKGQVRWRVITDGVAVHSAQPERGVNAIYRMASVLRALERWSLDRAPQLGEDPHCGRTTLSVGTIEGGIGVNVVPDRCAIAIDVRVLPDADPHAVRQDVIDHLAEAVPFPITHEEPFLVGLPLPARGNEELARGLVRAVQAEIGRGEAVGVPFGTDASQFAHDGIPSIVFGPGCIEQAHTKDEWIDLPQLPVARDALVRAVSGDL